MKIVLGYLTICLLWGSTWLVIRIGLESLTPVLAAGLRFLLAGTLIFFLMNLLKLKIQIDRQSIKLYAIMSLFTFTIPFSLIYWSEKYIPSGLTSILFASFPFFVALFSWFLLSSEKVSITKLAGIIIGFTGIVIIFSNDITLDFSNYLAAMLAVCIGAIMQAFSSVMVKKYGYHLHPLSLNFIPLLIAGFILSLTGLLFEDNNYLKFNWKTIFSISYLAIFGTVVTFTVYYWLLKKVNVVILSLSSFITPVIAVILGWFILHEHLSEQVMAGSSLVLIGILFANFTGMKNYYLARFNR